ncbi:MAG: molybdenum ABC transporter ATP-binding protein [Magnetococcales bacterium]|nr:molybdenum ABC transporter ATP-binding protein [Magnetococcales bacterium]
MKLESRFSLTRGHFTLNSQLSIDLTGITGLFGPSGGGKTTYLRCLAGLERATDGYIGFGDQIWQDESNNIFLPPFNRPVGVVFQESRLFHHLTVRENLFFGRSRSKGAEQRVSWQDTLDILELTALLDRLPENLSGGEQQRVAIGRAILTGPKLLIMDEPLASMDHQGKKKILQYILQIHKRLQLPILHVSHDMGEILQLADHLALMDQGRILANGPVSEIITRLDLPLAHQSDASTLLSAQVVHQDPHFHISTLAFGQSRELIQVPSQQLTGSETVRVRIYAKDVSLTLRRPEQTSILNIFSAHVVEIVAENPAQYMVKLSISGTPILSRITKKSLETLQIKAGLSLFVQVKSVALER